MTSSPIVAIGLEPAASRREWISDLSRLLDQARVVGLDEVDPMSVDVLVVGNPPGNSLRGFDALRFIQSSWAGVDRLIDGAPPVPIARMVAPELTESMTEFVVAAVLLLHRRFPSYRRDQTVHEWRPRPTVPASKRRVGVLGFGALGRPAAHGLAVAGFEVVAWARTARADRVEVLSGAAGFRQLLQRSEILVNLLPLTGETRGILDRAAFAALPDGAAVVNVARGEHVVASHLIEALDSGHLSDAVLDVFSEEPLPADHPFWSHQRVTVLPHVAAPSYPADLAPHIAANIERFLTGHTPRFLVFPG